MSEQPDGGLLERFDYLTVLRRRWLTVAMTVIVVVGAAVVSVLVATPVYEANVLVAVESPVSSTETELLGRVFFAEQELRTQLQVARSERVVNQAAERVGLSLSAPALLSRVHVALVPDSRVLAIGARDTDAARAADLAQAVADSYLDDRETQVLGRAVSALAELRARARLLEDEIASLEALPSLSSDNQRQRNVLSEELGAVRGQIAELSVAETFVAAGGEVIREATVPTQPVSPRPVATTLLALTLGLGLGVIGAYVRDRLDDRVREAPILERPPVGLQVLGQLPESEATATSGVDLLLAPLSPAAEAYRGLRSSLRFMSGSRAGDFRTIAVVSAEEAEGKTSVAANIAVAFAMTGQRVVVVDLDMRRPTLAGRFGLTTGVGASEVLSGQLAVGDAIVPVGVETLRLIGPGTSPPNPGSLITTGLRDMVGELTRVADVVVFDTPPMLAVADAMEVVAVVEATLTVARFGVSRRSAVRTATQRMRGLGANLVGAVITDVPTRATRYGYYGYGAGQDE